MGVDSTYWATRAATTTGIKSSTLTRLQTVNTLKSHVRLQKLRSGQNLRDFTPHHKPILFHPSSSAIDFLAPAYIKWASRPIKISIFSTPLQLLLEGQTDRIKATASQLKAPHKVWLVTQKPIQDLPWPEVLSGLSGDWPVLNIYCSPTGDLRTGYQQQKLFIYDFFWVFGYLQRLGFMVPLFLRVITIGSRWG